MTCSGKGLLDIDMCQMLAESLEKRAIYLQKNRRKAKTQNNNHTQNAAWPKGNGVGVTFHVIRDHDQHQTYHNHHRHHRAGAVCQFYAGSLCAVLPYVSPRLPSIAPNI